MPSFCNVLIFLFLFVVSVIHILVYLISILLFLLESFVFSFAESTIPLCHLFFFSLLFDSGLYIKCTNVGVEGLHCLSIPFNLYKEEIHSVTSVTACWRINEKSACIFYIIHIAHEKVNFILHGSIRSFYVYFLLGLNWEWTYSY